MKALAILAMLGLAGVAQADENNFDGNHLLTACSAAERFQDGSYHRGEWQEDSGFYLCHGYIKATMDTIDAMTLAYRLKPRVCVPENVTQGQIAMVYVKYLKEHPQNLQLTGSLLLMGALVENYPCK